MTINTSSNKTIVLGNGSQTQFAFGFVGVAAAYIEVIYTDASGNETVLAQGAGATQYQIALNAPVAGALWGVGGTVTYDPSGTPIPTGSSLTIFRTLPLTQAISLQNLVSLSTVGNGAETGLDTLEMQLQQVSELFGRAIVAPIVDPDTIDLTLPAAAQRANLVLGFDGDGNVIAAATPASGIISSAMQPVVNAASLAAGRAAFGLGAMAQEGIGAGLQDDGSGNARVNSPIQEVATNQAIHAANHLNVFAASGNLTFTLDQARTLFDGFEFTVYALTGSITFVPNATDNFFGAAGGGTLTIPKGAVATITTDGATTGVWYADVAGAPTVINVVKFTSGGTYTPSRGLVYATVECQGGGGGGGGCTGASTFVVSGGGGGGGAYATAKLSAAQIGPSQTVTVGAAGAPGGSSSAGGAGGASSFGSLCSATGGAGGISGSSSILAVGGAGGATGVGSVVTPGSDGTAGSLSSIAGVLVVSGKGGDAKLGFGGVGEIAPGSTGQSGSTGKGFGGGGSGSTVNNIASNFNGSTGAAGIVVVTEYLAYSA